MRAAADLYVQPQARGADDINVDFRHYELYR
jgi:hypothetical protein